MIKPNYKEVAKYIGESEDSGGELVKLLEEINQFMIDRKEGGLITQAIPEDGMDNPVVHIAVFTNKQTDFPLETTELYIKWIKDYAKALEDK